MREIREKYYLYHIIYTNMKHLPVLLLAVAAFPFHADAQEAGMRATYMVDGNKEKDQYRSNVSLESVATNECVTYVYGGAKLYMSSVRMNKTAGSSNDPDRENSCSNSVFLASDASQATLFKCEINSHTDKSFGVSAKGQGTLVKVSEGKTSVSKEQSAGFHAVDGAGIHVEDHSFTGVSHLSPAVSTGNGGTVEFVRVIGKTTGLASPLFSSMGQIHATECKMSAVSSPIGYIRDCGKIELDKCELEQGGSCGFLIYDGKSSERGNIRIEDCTLKIADGPLFDVNDNNVDIFVRKCKISQSDDRLMHIKGGSASLLIRKQKLQGDIMMDSIGSLDLTVGEASGLASAINPDNNRQARISVMLEESGQWQNTGVSYISSISFAAGLEKGLKQIKGQYDIYYDPSDPASSHLGGKEYATGGKGMLKPLK